MMWFVMWLSSIYLQKINRPVVSKLEKKCKFAEQQNQVGNLPSMVATHCDSLNLSINV